MIQKIIDAEAVLVNGRLVKASYRVRPGDVVSIRLPELPDTTPEPEDIPIEVVYEDDVLTVVNKPPGMVTHPARGNWRGTLVNALQFHYDTLSTLAGENRPGIVHRLDRDTTGLLIVVKDDHGPSQARRSVRAPRRSTRNTWRWSTASPSATATTSSSRSASIRPSREKMAIRTPADGGKEAVTFYEVVERFRGFALVRCKPQTGRTHQIRVHLTHIGHPILADKLYSGRDRITLGDLVGPGPAHARAGRTEPMSMLIDRQALHAHPAAVPASHRPSRSSI